MPRGRRTHSASEFVISVFQRLRFSYPKTVAFYRSKLRLNSNISVDPTYAFGNYGNGGCDGLTPYFL